MRRGMPGMGHAAMDWRPMPEPPLIWINTAVLLLASLAWEAARIGTRRGATALVRPGLIAAGALGVLFLGGPLLLWSQFATQGYFMPSTSAKADRKSDVSGKSVSVRVNLGVRRIIKKKNKNI